MDPTRHCFAESRTTATESFLPAVTPIPMPAESSPTTLTSTVKPLITELKSEINILQNIICFIMNQLKEKEEKLAVSEEKYLNLKSAYDYLTSGVKEASVMSSFIC